MRLAPEQRFRTAIVVTIVAWLAAPLAAAGDRPPATITLSDAILTIAEEVEVSAGASGRLRELSVREGSLVAEGDALLRVDDRLARLASERAAIELARAAAEAQSDVKARHAAKASELAQSEHRRALAIDAASPASVSDRELDRLRLSADVAELDVERAQHERRMARLELKLGEQAQRVARLEQEQHSVAAPIAGLVVELHKRPGEWADRGEPVLTLVRVDRLRAEGFLHVSRATIDLIGAGAVFRVELPGGETLVAPGEVAFVSPRADPVTALARVWVEFPVTDRRLRPGLRGSVTITPAAPQRIAAVESAVESARQSVRASARASARRPRPEENDAKP